MVRIAGVATGVGLIAYLVWSTGRRTSTGNSNEQILLHLCLGDKKQMKRLIALEAAATPNLSKREYVVRAIEKLKRDNS
jgi:hypothetical protein